MGATVAVLLAAGRGVRLGRGGVGAGGGVNKALVSLGGEPIVVHATRPFAAHPAIDQVMVVAPREDLSRCGDALTRAGYPHVSVIAGGPTRHSSEWLALQRLAPTIRRGDVELVVIHDAARPLYRGEHLEDLLAAARESGGAILAIPFQPEDEVIQDQEGRPPTPAPTQGLWRAQTPQAFRAGKLHEAFLRAEQDGFEGPDTSSTVERIGVDVRVLPGEPRNIKVTYPEDLVHAESLLEGGGTPG